MKNYINISAIKPNYSTARSSNPGVYFENSLLVMHDSKKPTFSYTASFKGRNTINNDLNDRGKN